MAEFKPLFTTESLIEKIKSDPTIRFKCDLAIAVPCSQTTILYYDEKGLIDLKAVEEALNENRVKAKKRIMDDWNSSREFTKQITAFRLMATTEEREAIAQGGGAKKSENDNQIHTINISWQNPAELKKPQEIEIE